MISKWYISLDALKKYWKWSYQKKKKKTAIVCRQKEKKNKVLFFWNIKVSVYKYVRDIWEYKQNNCQCSEFFESSIKLFRKKKISFFIQLKNLKKKNKTSI